MFCKRFASRPDLLRYQSLNIRISANLIESRNVVQQILEFQSCERVGQDLWLWRLLSLNLNQESNSHLMSGALHEKIQFS